MKKLALFGFILIIVFITAYIFSKKKENIKEIAYKPLFSITEDISVYSKTGVLDVGKNIIYIKVPKGKELKSMYFYMPPMPGMGEMREDVSIKKLDDGLYEGVVNISMAGGWQVVANIDLKEYKVNISVPLKSGESKISKKGIDIDSQKLKLIGIKTDTVKRLDLTDGFEVVGYVSFDSSKIHIITLRSDGWVVDTFGRFEGEYITKGTNLLKVLNPDLEIANQELKILKESGKEDLADLTKQKVMYLRGSNIIKSPVNGIIVEKNVSEGSMIKSGEVAYKIIDTSNLWIIADVPQEYVDRVKKGLEVLITPVGSQESFTGYIDYIFPVMDKDSRTLKVRVSSKNRKLKINQLLSVYIENKSTSVIAIPEEAVIDTGKKQIVFVKEGDGSFQPRIVKLGKKFNNYYEIVDGLQEGEEIVVNGNFLLDSEAQLRGLY
ncbi:MAG: efflux RND transporter periplasmic adaptor subunit [Hydrogenothermaceae bacterium]|nr:efflux RND transporter periplasmic adaptor subunit [Hydrogenothermaceae bacterium]